MPAAADRSPLRKAALAVAALAVLALGLSILDRVFNGELTAPVDFTEYWAAGKLGAEGQNAYDGTKVRELQRGLGLNDKAIMMWNPPWTLTLVMPLGLLPFRTAYDLWVLLHLGLMVASAELLWRGLGGPKHARGLAYLITLTFVPTTFVIGSGQITAIVLVGLAGFLALREKHPFLAGAVGALTAVKPHLLVLFALWLILDATRDRAARKTLLGGALVGLLACLPPTVVNPEIWSQYLSATTGASSADHQNLSGWAQPLAGWWLRMAVPGHPFWVQLLPLVIGVSLFAAWWFRKKESPSVPALVGLSLLIAPYGAWQFDLVLLLVPILAVAVKLVVRPAPRAAAVGIAMLVLVNAALVAMMLTQTWSAWYVWVAPTVLLGCVTTLRLAEHPEMAPRPLGA